MSAMPLPAATLVATSVWMKVRRVSCIDVMFYQ
jgi:hypothetical protein